ncbi:MAG: acyloxyacyl hydrolase [Flavobacteriales bacterium]|nr:acyloxyacyl hydrolase [Flavobacteriales bacterium]
MFSLKKIIVFVASIVFLSIHAQEKSDNSIDVSHFYGNIIRHQPNIAHLVQGHPTGIIVGLNKKTNGTKNWQKEYNYPDYGLTMIYEDFKAETLGKTYFLGMHFNFYFFNRNLVFKIAQGIAYNTNPYDKFSNNKNVAFGSSILAGTHLALLYKKDYLIDKFGIQAGIIFTHFSNGSAKSPNAGINTYGVNLGINYSLDEEKKYSEKEIKEKYSEPIKYNFSIKTGINEYFVGQGMEPFIHLNTYADKRFSKKSAVQGGVDLFLNKARKEYIEYVSIAYAPEGNVIDKDTDYKRIGLFAGYELFISDISFESQIGYYIYNPLNYDKDIIYSRVGMKYYFNDHFFSSFHVKTHYFNAEALEFGVGIRL